METGLKRIIVKLYPMSNCAIKKRERKGVQELGMACPSKWGYKRRCS
jgi:hypothetical protein